LSGSISESEPNNSAGRADPLPRETGELLHVRGSISTPAVRDWFKVRLRAGGVLGVSVATDRDPDDHDYPSGLYDDLAEVSDELAHVEDDDEDVLA
jgi:hypothetical protein